MWYAEVDDEATADDLVTRLRSQKDIQSAEVLGAALPIRAELGGERCLGARFRIRPHPTQGLLHCVILTRS